MKSILAQQSPQSSSPWAPARLRQEDADRRQQEICGEVQRAANGLRRREELWPRGKDV
jgi:hypothetical protein